jgi:hypothetical protein
MSKATSFIAVIFLLFSIASLSSAVPGTVSSPNPANGATNVSLTLPSLSWEYDQGTNSDHYSYKVWLWDADHSPSGFTYKFTMYGKRYYLSNSAMNWSDAKAACSAAGGCIASSFTSQINGLLVNNCGGNTCWLGLSDAVSEGTWVLEDGRAYNYTNWNSSEPNNSGGDEDYTEVGTNGKWNDVNGTGTRYFFLEANGFMLNSAITATAYFDLDVVLQPNHTYYWQVQPYNGDGSGSSTVYSFTTGSTGSIPSASNPIFPSDGATGIAVNPLLQWDSVPGADYYKLYVWKARTGTEPGGYGTSLGVYNGHGYSKSSSTYTWSNAKTICEAGGGYIISINSADENALHPTDYSYWMGMSDAEEEGNIKWANQDPLMYSNWAPGEPNDYNSGEDYYELTTSGQWNDNSSTVSIRFICELPAEILDGTVVHGTSYSMREFNLAAGQTYNWMVVPYSQYGRPFLSGYWAFTTTSGGTAPGTISDEYPANGASDVPLNAILSWTAPSGSPIGYYMYLGTNNTLGDHGYEYTDLGTLNGHHYYRSTEQHTWSSAEATAEQLGGYLATIGSANENNLLSEAAGDCRLFGGNDRITNNIFRYANHDPWVYTRWYAGEPNNNLSIQYFTDINFTNSGEWDDVEIDVAQPYLMETVPNIDNGTYTAAASFTPTNLQYNTAYYWIAVATNDQGMASEPRMFYFITTDGRAKNPSPATGTAETNTYNFDWDDVTGATGYLFYLGTADGTWDLVNGELCATRGSDYTYTGTYDPRTTYYWKVDTQTSTTTITGTTWSFTTAETTLPVELSSFTAVQTAEDNVLLAWTAQSETGMAGYNIFRNATRDFSTAVSINGRMIVALNSATVQSYTFSDIDVTMGSTYNYWIECVDVDGSCHVAGPIAVTLTVSDPGEHTPDAALIDAISSCYPNPFNPSTTISYTVANDQSPISVAVFNMRGQLVRHLQSGTVSSGIHHVVWNGTDQAGKACSSGLYFTRVQIGASVFVQKISMMK